MKLLLVILFVQESYKKKLYVLEKKWKPFLKKLVKLADPGLL